MPLLFCMITQLVNQRHKAVVPGVMDNLFEMSLQDVPLDDAFKLVL